MEEYILIDKYNNEHKFTEINDILKYGESLGSPIFMKLANDIDIDHLVYHFLQLEYSVVTINSNSIVIYFGDRIDSNRLNYIKKLTKDKKHITIKYSFKMFDGVISCKEILGDNFEKVLNSL